MHLPIGVIAVYNANSNVLFYIQKYLLVICNFIILFTWLSCM